MALLEHNLQNIDTLQLFASKSKVSSQSAVQPGQEKACANVREETDRGFRHGEDRVLGSNTERCVDGKTDTATHSNAIHEGYVRLGVCRNQVVELVFKGEVVLGRLLALRSALVRCSKRSNVSTCAESSALALYDHYICELALFPLLQPGHNLSRHASIQGVELLRSVEGDGPYAVLLAKDNIIWLIARELVDADGGCELERLAVS